MDKVYKTDIPAFRVQLEELKVEFSRITPRTDWSKLRIEPLLKHVRRLERHIDASRFAAESSRLPRGVAMFHSDLVYLRTNIKSLRETLAFETKKKGRRTKKD